MKNTLYWMVSGRTVDSAYLSTNTTLWYSTSDDQVVSFDPRQHPCPATPAAPPVALLCCTCWLSSSVILPHFPSQRHLSFPLGICAEAHELTYSLQ